MYWHSLYWILRVQHLWGVKCSLDARGCSCVLICVIFHLYITQTISINTRNRQGAAYKVHFENMQNPVIQPDRRVANKKDGHLLFAFKVSFAINSSSSSTIYMDAAIATLLLLCNMQTEYFFKHTLYTQLLQGFQKKSLDAKCLL